MKRVILAGIELPADKDFSSLMEETEALCEACGYVVAGKITQKSRSMDPHTGFRKGKLDELRSMKEMLEADGIIFHNTLGAQMAKRIAAFCDAEVMDRIALILHIFSLRAKSRQAKLQVELASLQYRLPEVLDDKDTSGHERGGSAYNRGAGEIHVSLVQRKYKQRIQDLKKELKKIESQKFQDERHRTKSMLKKAALIGYTNAGKSSFMNAMLDQNISFGQTVYEEDMLFATLDTSVRMIEKNGKRFLLYDTVGFVSDLPHLLVEAFQSTLDAARDADLLIHVIDISDPNWQKKAMITEETLKQIHADHIPVYRLYNKIDKVKEPVEVSPCVSCLKKEGLDVVTDEILNLLYPMAETVTCLIPYDELYAIHPYRNVVTLQELERKEEGILMKVSGEENYVNAFHKYMIEQR